MYKRQVCTLCSPDAGGNLFAAVNLQDDEDVIQIDKISNASEPVSYTHLIVVVDGDVEVLLQLREDGYFGTGIRFLRFGETERTPFGVDAHAQQNEMCIRDSVYTEIEKLRRMQA